MKTHGKSGILCAVLTLGLGAVGCTVHEADADEPMVEGDFGGEVEVSEGEDYNELEYETDIEADVNVDADDDPGLYGEADLYGVDDVEAEAEIDVD